MYPGLHDPARWVLPQILARQAAERPGAPLVRTLDGAGRTAGELTYAQAAADAARVAGFLAGLGVRSGDPVAVMLPNGLDFVRVWFGLCRLGAVAVLLNTELKGAFLEHQILDSGAALAIADASAAARFADIAPRIPGLKTLLASEPVPDLPFRTVPLDGWRAAAPYDGPMPGAADIACIMYTSGTTGPSKGVLMPQAHCCLFGVSAVDVLRMTPADRYYITLPLFHANGLLMQLGATLLAGASAVVRPRFSASAWVEDIRAHGCTLTNLLGAVGAFVCARAPTPGDRDHSLRAVTSAPNPPAHEATLRTRFGVPEVVSVYGMTEVNIPLYGELGVARPGTCGRAYDRYFEVTVADADTDVPVPPEALSRGAVGELLVRPRAAFGFMAGYHRMPEATVAAWRNLWFHTGDAVTMAADGYVVFVDRIKDCIRRRGENISSFEVESAIERLPGVAEAAAYAVPSGIDGGEDEVMLAVVPESGATLDPAAIAAHADRELPRYAQPRFIEIVPELPKTPTAKVQKAKLRARGVGPGTWDRVGEPSIDCDPGARGGRRRRVDVSAVDDYSGFKDESLSAWSLRCHV
ncbi:MAG: AMP-binding protein [Alphaproteobacteria bacterium]